jgi:hypothetical protein
MPAALNSLGQANLSTQLLEKLCLLALFVACAACAQTGVRPLARTRETGLAPPKRILISVAANESAVTEYQGILRQQPSQRDPVERRREIARQVNEIAMAQMIEGLQQLGFGSERVGQHLAATDNDLILEGRFITIDEGNPFRRWAIGFGSGLAKIEILVQLLQGSQRQLLLEFVTKSDSGKLPGAVATVPVSAAVPAGVGIAMAAGSAVGTGINITESQMTRMAAASADQVVRYLSDFFAQQGWIDNKQIKQPRFTY